MKKFILFLLLILSMTSMAAPIKIDRVEPTNWYVGMKDASLQLMVYGKDIRSANVTVDYPGVKVDSIVRLDSPNYLIVYLNLNGAKAGTMTLNFTGDGAKKAIKYELRNRDMPADKRMGFTNADVLYQLMPDRFASSGKKHEGVDGLNAYKVDRSKPSLRHGGDLEGIRQHLDYFNRLGVTALWFTPVMENNSPDQGQNSSYHGYATTNYYRVDPRFGTNEEYKQFISEAHQHGLKVIMDMIFNHCGYYHPWLKDMPSKDWFNETDYKNHFLQTSYKLTPVLDPYASKVDMNETVNGWFVLGMPDLNQKNPHVIKYLIQNSIWWIESVGIDGIRMDTYPYADRKAMAKWMKTIDTEYPNFNSVGETWVTEPAYTAAWQKDSKLTDVNSYLKTVMDFSLYDKLSRGKYETTDNNETGFNRVYNSLVYDYLYVNPSSVMAFIENHDTDRFLGKSTDPTALKQALAILLTIDRIPQLYYGTEVLMNGTKEITDGYVRGDYPGGFAGDSHNCFTEEGRSAEQNAMFNWMSKLIKWRVGNKLITEGKQTQFLPHNGVYVIARQYNGKTSMTILNGTDKANKMDVARYKEIIGNNTVSKDILTDRTINLNADVQLAPREALILEF